jgi:predicted O-methyltransferase YrrM
MLRQFRGEARSNLGDTAVRAADALLQKKHVGVDFPPRRNEPRWGYGKAMLGGLAEQIKAAEAGIADTLGTLGSYREQLELIERQAVDPTEPSWLNDYLPALDGAAIYGFLRSRRPARYLEIGSGFSTKFAARAKRDGGLSTEIVSIDPHPRAEIDALCDRVIRMELESADQEPFMNLGQGDVVFFDGSHVAYMNSDVVAFMLEILPRIPPGVLVGVHDIYLPDDYPADIAQRYYNEQYVLAAYLLGAAERVNIVLPAMYASAHMPTPPQLEELFAHPNLRGVDRHGCAFWFDSPRTAGDRMGAGDGR